MTETVYEVRMGDMVVVVFNNRADAEQKAQIMNDIFGDDDYHVVEVQKDSL